MLLHTFFIKCSYTDHAVIHLELWPFYLLHKYHYAGVSSPRQQDVEHEQLNLADNPDLFGQFLFLCLKECKYPLTLYHLYGSLDMNTFGFLNLYHVINTLMVFTFLNALFPSINIPMSKQKTVSIENQHIGLGLYYVIKKSMACWKQRNNTAL